MMWCDIVLVFSLFFWICMKNSEGAKILLLPTDHLPNVRMLASVSISLSANGHEPTILIPDKYKEVASEIGAMPILVKTADLDEFKDYYERVNQSLQKEGIDKLIAIWRDVNSYCSIVLSYCRAVFTNAQLLQKIKDEQFDIAIVDGLELSQCLFAIPHKLNLPYITMTWEIAAWVVQIPQMASISGQYGVFQFPEPPTFLARLWNFILHTAMYISYPHLCHNDEHIAHEFAPEQPKITYQELVRKSQVVLITRDNFCMDYPRLESPHFHFIGGPSAMLSKPLPLEFDHFVRQAEHGVIVVSFGSLVKTLINPLMVKFMDAFKHIPQRIVMHFEGEFDEVPSNVLLSKWIPQNDILADNKTVLYIGHGGQFGQSEAHFHGVPMIIVPFVWDQSYVATRVVSKEYGKSLDPFTFTSNDLVKAINEVISNPRYKENMQKCSNIIRSYRNPHESIVWWVNHVVNFGGDHLKPQFSDMPTYQFFMLDVLVFLLVISCSLLVLGLKLCKMCFKVVMIKMKVKKD